ncbi:hypothetical protein NL322_27595, partial [Klebsiella pneumoniae]|nr:hypothetical protein [Klebsiella pneumoniae]
VVVLSSTDEDLVQAVTVPPDSAAAVLEAAVATDVLAARDRVVADLTRRGAVVVEAPPSRLAAAAVGAYLGLKARARV